MATFLLDVSQSRAAMQTFEKEYTYAASELDSKSSCRTIALEQVKRILLQELGAHVESVFNDKASSDKNYQRAVEDFNRAMELNPKLAEAYEHRGAAYGYLGDYQRSLEDYRVAARLGSASAQEFLRKRGKSW